MTDKMRIETALAGLSDLVQDVETDGFPAAVLHLLPELWRLFQKHRGDVHAMRAALQAADAQLAHGRTDVDALLAGKNRAEGT